MAHIKNKSSCYHHHVIGTKVTTYLIPVDILGYVQDIPLVHGHQLSNWTDFLNSGFY